jgi:hypothetical protein
MQNLCARVTSREYCNTRIYALLTYKGGKWAYFPENHNICLRKCTRILQQLDCAHIFMCNDSVLALFVRHGHLHAARDAVAPLMLDRKVCTLNFKYADIAIPNI